MIIGYVVYLVVALFNGELFFETMDFLAFYLPALHAYLIDTFPWVSNRVTLRETQGKIHAQKEEGAKGSRHNKEQVAAAVFTLRDSCFSATNLGDMAMTSAVPNYNSTGITDAKVTFADFGMDIRESEHKDDGEHQAN